MARPRVYRHDARCPECGSKRLPKDGTSQGRQADHCGDCGCPTIPDAAYQRPGAADQERALAMYQERQFIERYRPNLRASVCRRSDSESKGWRVTPPDAPTDSAAYHRGRHGADSYPVYGLPLSDGHQVGKGSTENRNEGRHSRCQGQLTGVAG